MSLHCPFKKRDLFSFLRKFYFIIFLYIKNKSFIKEELAKRLEASQNLNIIPKAPKSLKQNK
jgi:hypothetical protein